MSLRIPTSGRGAGEAAWVSLSVKKRHELARESGGGGLAGAWAVPLSLCRKQ